MNPEYSLKEQMLKLTLQYFGHLMRRANSLEKTLMLGKIEGKRRRGQQRMRWLDECHGELTSPNCRRSKIQTCTGKHVRKEKHERMYSHPTGCCVGTDPQQTDTLRNTTSDQQRL